MVDTFRLTHSNPNKVVFELPHLNEDLELTYKATGHLICWRAEKGEINTITRELTGNPGLPVDPQDVSWAKPMARELCYLSNIWWAMIGGTPPVAPQGTTGSGFGRLDLGFES